jgi:predicted ester cyclase
MTFCAVLERRGWAMLLSMSNREIVERALVCFADPARRPSYFDLYAEHVVLHGYAGVDPGLASVKRYYAAFWAAFPDAAVRPDDIVEEGDKMVLRYRITGTHLGPFLGIAPTGRPISFAGMTMLAFSAGQCVERWSIADSVSLLAQLGVEAVPKQAS